ncbi:hypothetical protein [Sphingomonas sp. Leaf257]|jgi:hypothetical protein|uniref:hypothetical protein n=1 Tax=Sphingomonas sp. Leaf257 TaxID=1736309 RepID=UPI0006FC1B01|nr:hypothetical protein [Sphingomonas sp. Leaf257]KQO55552.1 hypothetical protein ASF14_04100 [Sphingomonas sp. Leaf257]
MKSWNLLVALACATVAHSPAYSKGIAAQDNPEISALFNADQAARENIKPEQFKAKAFVSRIIADDHARRERTQMLLQQDKLKTADDFYHAAFIFQHGNAASDYLLAHTLALAAAARGRKDAAWIAAATLDRYLQTIGQKQIYGTQYLNRRETGPTMELYDRTLVPDPLREALGVPPQVKQEERLQTLKSSGALTP